MKRDENADLPELAQARSLWIANRVNESLRIYDRAVRLYPDNPVALVEAAGAFAGRFEIGRAEEFLSRLRLQRNSDPTFLLAAAKCHQVIGWLDEAISCCNEVLATSPDLFEAHLELARIFERVNQFERGFEHTERALAQQPDSPAANLIHGQWLRRAAEMGKAEAVFRRLASDLNSPNDIRVSSLFQLGYLLDETGRFDEAFESVSKAKQIQQQNTAGLPERSRKEIANLEGLWTTLSRADVERWGTELAQLPQEKIVFLLGPPRSGTTLIERILRSHPKINSTDEEHFLSQVILPELLNYRQDRALQLQDLNQLTAGRLKIERERYFRYLTALLREDSRGRRHVDKNPSLLRLLPAVLRLFPESSILCAIRDPRDVAISCFLRQFPLNTVSAEFLSLEGTVKSVVRDLELWERLKKIIPNGWLEIRYERMISATESTSKELLQFLDVPWDASVLDFHQLTAPVNSPTYEAVSKPIFQTARGRWANYEQFLAPYLPMLEPVLEQLHYSGF